jgi:PIN domain nuclease of toxin-antitoxin system
VILLDTHVVIWLGLNPERISRSAILAIEELRNKQMTPAISGVTLYEIALLAARNRVAFRSPVEAFLDEVENRFDVKPITARICAETMRLPDSYPKDPMDRIIGATAIVEGCPLITADAVIQASKAVATVW